MTVHRAETLTCDTDDCRASITNCAPLDALPIRRIAEAAGWATTGNSDRCPACAHLVNPYAERWRQLQGPAAAPTGSCWVCDTPVTVLPNGHAAPHPFSPEIPDCPGACMAARRSETRLAGP